jgi:HlyD family secretion protein
MRRAIIGVLLLLLIAAAAWFLTHRAQPPPSIVTAAVTRGPIVKIVASTGTLQAVTSVDVGAEISGIIASLGADFNSMVTKGQTLATLDPSLLKAAVEQARANLAQASADVDRLRAAQSVADLTLGRDRTLAAHEMLPVADLESAETDSHTTAADVAAALAKVTQAEADVKNAEVNLAKSVITSPIDGVVIARNIDVGQTVASSFNTPTLFVIAADLAKMQINANIDESDVGMIKVGQDASFRVDAFPNDTFRGVVSQVRLNAATVNNVVTYSGIIDAPNPQLKLKPGMTANLTVEIDRRDDVLRVPDAALRFKPPNSTSPPPPAPTGASPARVATVRAAGPPTVWRSDGGGLFPIRVKTGLDDGTFTELIDPPFAAGTLLVTQAR